MILIHIAMALAGGIVIGVAFSFVTIELPRIIKRKMQ
jgi:hypothetical protein